VPCERLFSAGAEIATDRRSRIGPKLFEELQVLKHAWRPQIVDIAQSNSHFVEEVEVMQEYRDMLEADDELADWESHDSIDVVTTI
jgi:hypothetical protein